MDCSLPGYRQRSMGFSREEYWSGLPFPSPGNLPDPRMKPELPELAIRFFTTELLGKQALVPFYRWENESSERLGKLNCY